MMMMMASPAVRIVEVGPRDGLQAIEETIPTSLKIQLIQRLAKTGLKTIEVTSFTAPRWIPQLADHEEVMDAVNQINTPGISYSVLVPNLKGLLAAAKAGAKEVGVFVSATEGFSRKNNNCNVAEALARAKEVADEAARLGIQVRGYVSCIFACPFDGPTEPQRVLDVAKALLDMGCFEISLGDTIGVGTPAQVQRLLKVLFQAIPAHRLAGHFHDTYGQAVANSVTAYNLGLRTFDSSVGGLGGCPYSPGAKGNLASEDIVYTFEKMGISTGVDLEQLVEIGHWINKRIGKENSSRAGAAIYSKRHNLQAKSPLERRKEKEEKQRQSEKQQPAAPTTSKTWTLTNNDSDYQLFRRGSNVRIVLNRPRNGNALTRTMLTNLTSLFGRLSKDPSVFRIILTANGKFFCTGMDLSGDGATADSASSDAKQALYDGFYRLFEAIDRAPQTTIALINGPCYGGGTGLAFVCDIRLAKPDVSFTMTEVKLGLCPATISKFVTREWGPAIAREAMLTARPVTAEELRNVGVIHGLTTAEQSLDALLDVYLDRYLKYAAPQASARTKELVAAGWRYTGDERQDKAVKDVFEWMIAPSDEARVGTALFRAGGKGVDWEAVWVERSGKAKL